MNVLYLGTVNDLFSITTEAVADVYGIKVECEEKIHKGVIEKLQNNEHYDIVFCNNSNTLKSVHDINPNILGCIISDGMKVTDISAVMQTPFKTAVAISYSDIILVLKSAYELIKKEDDNIVEDNELPNIEIRCFGTFEVFINGDAMLFKSRKAKELLALLVSKRGGSLTTEELIAFMYPDRPNCISTQNLSCKMKNTLKKELEKNNAAHIISTIRGAIRCNPKYFNCDYYDALAGDLSAQRKFLGEYMSQYDWAEDICGYLTDKFL